MEAGQDNPVEGKESLEHGKESNMKPGVRSSTKHAKLTTKTYAEDLMWTLAGHVLVT